MTGALRRLAARHPRLAYAGCLAAVAVVGGYALSLGVRTWRDYVAFKSNPGGSERVYKADPELGYTAIPRASMVRVMGDGPPVPMRFSMEGFRIPAGAPPFLPKKRPYVLALGCSFTFGDGCAAEEAYPERAAQLLGGTAINAGKCGYGLAQMLVLARRLIPQYRPEYVIAQHSFWLIGRGTSGFERSTLGRLPAPYLVLGADGKAFVQPPAFRTRQFELPVEPFTTPARGPREFASFLWRVGLPLYSYDDTQMAWYAMRRWSGRLPQPPRDRDDRLRLLAAVYREMGELCREAGSRLVIVRLGKPFEQSWVNPRRFDARALFVNAQALLDGSVPERTEEAYYRRFGIWRGDPPQLVDTHPSPDAHLIAARAIVQALKQDAARSRP